MLSVLRHLNYKPWFAIAEFVDNSLQSFLANREALHRVDGTAQCRVHVRLEGDPPRLTVRDNAAGIAASQYDRAFRPAEIPADRSGLSEFGMGMKSAACWFSPRWQVRTSALDESGEATVRFDIGRIVDESIEHIDVVPGPALPQAHFTEIILEELYKPPVGSTVRKIKDHLAGIYRMFLRSGELELKFNDEVLLYQTPNILAAPRHNAMQGQAYTWRKDIDFDFGLGLRARGFAALRDRASTSEAGFALFRRRRLIEGSADEGYRPEAIFGKPNSYRYQRVFGELEVEGFDISHTKDGFRWDENEDPFLEALRDALDSDDLPLLEQAEHYRSRAIREDAGIRYTAQAATDRTAAAIQNNAPAVVDRLASSVPVETPAPALVAAPPFTQRVIEADLLGDRWRIVLELTNDPVVGDWVEVADTMSTMANKATREARTISVRLSLAHPFTMRFVGADGTGLESLVRVAAGIGLAEVAARSGGVRAAGTVRRNLNDLLRNALSSETA